MLTLFPQYRLGLGISWLLTAVLAGFMLRAGTAWYWPAATILLCGFLSLAIAELAATSRHRSLLLILYQDGDPQRFLELYQPLLKQRGCSASQALTVRAYLSNAYLALGDAQTALRILDEAAPVQGREAQNARALLAGNRCSIYLQMEDLPRAEAQLAALRQLQQENAPSKAGLYDAIPQLEIRCAILRGSVTRAQAEAMTAIAEETQSPLLQADRQLQLAKIDLLQRHTETARARLEALAQGRSELWAVQQARDMLAVL